MRRGMAMAVALLTVSGLLTACASARTPGDPPVALPTPTETLSHGQQGDGPPPFVVRFDSTQLELAAAGWCYRNACADGLDMDPPSVGSPDDVLVFLPGAEFTSLSAIQFTGERHSCESRSLDAVVDDLGAGWWQIHPQGPADAYTFDLFASGSGPTDLLTFGGGSADMSASLRWTTTEDNPVPEPTATLVLVVNHDGEPDSYGLELSIAGLSTQPKEYSATITVTAANGRSLTFDATPADFCTGAGALYFDGPDAKGVAAARLGDFPFTYDVELVLDDETYDATAGYAADSARIDTPLEFVPSLP